MKKDGHQSKFKIQNIAGVDGGRTMARITVEDCLKKVESRFGLVILAAGRAKTLLSGAKSVVETDNREIVTALREVAEGKVYFVEPETEETEPSPESITPLDSEGKEGEKSSEG